MKATILLSMIVAMTFLSTSCKKESTPEPVNNNVIVYPDFSMLDTGNYWIYQRFLIDSIGNETPQSIYDSCYIEKDTLINGKTYYKYYDPYLSSMSSKCLRDSLHYVIDSSGDIVLSTSDFSTVLSVHYSTVSSDTVCRIERKMEDKNQSVQTGAGTFTTINAKITYYMYPGWDYAGSVRYRNIRYAEGIGKVTETLPFFVSSPNYTERRLVRYHVN